MSTRQLHNEQQLLLRVSEGDETAFQQLLYAYSDRLGAFVYKLTHSREVAQEIVQDTFIKVWHKRATLPEVGHAGKYLFIIARNLTYNHIRDQARMTLKYQDWLQDMENSDATPGDDEGLAQYLPVIEQAVSQLPPQQRKVFELVRKQGLSHKQIAEQMQLSPESVKKYRKLALQFIREYVRHRVPFPVLLVVLLPLSY
ncbi:RNA polymerase sigma factor [Chitinophaga qingshengii]|uniref:RNA polymerase sigma-70 factor n=1 Tax=Chitinophaga qingshengii TaxID=1569794 RepID=A0ABR7TXT0_9BACT|nr:RNA polymerase sigma-70 factor [Chitinophaga qingshengii]MBC9934935.1 RNA polymerase sigma-70 factor [Chitinophaga qingshengii]